MDKTEGARRAMVAAINTDPNEREALEQKYGKVRQEFEVLGFAAPFVIVTEKLTGHKGSLMFQHDPRYYFSFAK